MNKKDYDFSGYATRNDLRCSDGRTIRRDAFKEMDGRTVPLVWHHRHDGPENVLGHALLENREDGVYTYGKFNDSFGGENAKLLVEHGDITGLSIYANQLKQSGGDVLHGVIREVSLVLAGANPGAFIDCPVIEHAEDTEFDAVIYTGLEFDDHISHEDDEESEEEEGETEEMAKEKTVQDVFDTLNEEQKKVVYFMIGEALKQQGGKEGGEEEADAAEHSDIEGDYSMKRNVFDNSMNNNGAMMSHADVQAIFTSAKRLGSLKDAVEDSGFLQHDDDPVEPTTPTYGVYPLDYLFPDYKSLNTPPEFIKRDTSWVSALMGAVHHTPFTRIKSMFADITADEARAKGYVKGNEKTNEVFTLLKRTTDPQTIYKKQKMDRDDIIDITDFDVVRWIKAEMRQMLDEEIARAVLLSDGRETADPDHISEDHVRSIVHDADLYTIKKTVELSDYQGTNAEQIITDTIIAAKVGYEGSGNPICFMGESTLTQLLLARDTIGHKLYTSEEDLAKTLRVGRIVTVPIIDQMLAAAIAANEADDTEFSTPIAIIVNPKDYTIGADKGGNVELFDDFDIDYNQYKYLIETRISGALTKPKSAIVVNLVNDEEG